ncbi:phosphocholine cytidylyltransferase family protein [Candidatus Dojkabacteria bacterium]|nr:phosphocholine cytidylyltransferase family protein [Candidatus Dojkabacteria bacterium]
MKAIILAAGRGIRFGKMTEATPKCMLKLGVKSILHHQVDTLNNAGVQENVIVKGYLSNKIPSLGMREYINSDYANTNMLYSLFCAKKELYGDVIISYADVIYENALLNKLLEISTADINVVIDKDWKEYYQERFGNPFSEAESLILSPNHTILNIGESSPCTMNVQGQYIGLIRLNDNGCKLFKEYYEYLAGYCNEKWKFRGRSFKCLYMTDFLQILIDKGVTIKAIPVSNGWLEFDSVSDYKLAIKWHASGILKRFFRNDI